MSDDNFHHNGVKKVLKWKSNLIFCRLSDIRQNIRFILDMKESLHGNVTLPKKSPFSIKQHFHSVCSLPGLLCSLFYRQGLSKLLYQFLLSHLKEHLIVSMGNLLSKNPTLHHSKPCLSIIVYFCFAVADFAFEAATLSDLISCDNVLQYLDLILFA